MQDRDNKIDNIKQALLGLIELKDKYKIIYRLKEIV